jgi:hypothetical protein
VVAWAGLIRILMRKLKQTRKLQLDSTTIKQLTDVVLGDVAGGITGELCTEGVRCGVYTQSCSVRTPGCP